MEKIFIKPVSQEILLKGGIEGRADIFSYDYDLDEDKRGLGNLFIVGNVQGNDGGEEDNAYITSLVASLAKREYYFNPQITPREAFAAALKKINDVVEEFFKNKDLKINIGIFAIADENVLISKLGKFKIYLARDGKNIDILNNIELFSKEHIQEKKFSNIISGKVHPGDKILAFYPSRSVTAREKSIRDNFLKSEGAQFVAKINSIKEDKKDFACAAIYIDINEIKAPIEKKAKQHIAKEMPPIPAGINVGGAILASKETASIQTKPEEKLEIKSALPVKPETAIIPEKPKIVAEPVQIPQEMPKIIAKEFSLGKKRNPLSIFAKRFQISEFNPRKKLISYASSVVGIALVIAIAIVVKSLFFTGAQEKQINTAVKSAQSEIKTAQNKKGANDTMGARQALFSALLDLEALNSNSGKVNDTINQITKLMDEMDQAVDGNPSLAGEISQDFGKANILTVSGGNLTALVSEGDKIYLVKIDGSSPKNVTEIKDMTPSFLIGSKDGKYTAVTDGNKMTVATEDGKTKSFDINAGNLKSVAFYEDNLYLLGDKIYKIADLNAKAPGKLQEWSKEPVSQDNNLIAVDGNVFLIGKNGILETFYIGKKTGEKNTGIVAETDTILMTTKDSKNLYLVNKKLGRIYVVEKETGNLMKTIKIGNSQPIISAAMDASENIFILTKDNKIWKLQ